MMEITPVSAASRTRKARAVKAVEPKAGKTAIKKPAAAKVTLKKPRAKKVPVAAATPEVMVHDTALMQQLIAEAAYYLAERRHFTPGAELQDWLLAEQQIRLQYITS